MLALVGGGAMLSLPVLSWWVGGRARDRADALAADLGLTIDWSDVSVSITGLPRLAVQVEALDVRRGDAPLLQAGSVEAEVAWRDGELVVEHVQLRDATAHARIRDDRPVELLALGDAWRLRAGRATTPQGGADGPNAPDGSGDPGDPGDPARPQRPWPKVRLERLRVVVAAQGGRSAALDGLMLVVEGADVALVRGASDRPRPLGTVDAIVMLQGPATGAGSVQVRSDEAGVELALQARDRWRWTRPVGPLQAVGLASLQVHIEPDAALALRATSQAEGGASIRAALDALRGSLLVRGVEVEAGQGARASLATVRAAWPGAAMRVEGLAAHSATLAALQSLLPAKVGTTVTGWATALQLPAEASVSLDVTTVDAGKIAVLLAGGGEPAIRGLRLQVGERRVEIGRVEVRRPGATLIGERKPAEIHVAAVRVDAGDLTPPLPSPEAADAAPTPPSLVPPSLLQAILRLQRATERRDDAEPAPGSAEAGPPPEALRPLWTSTPAKTEPATRKYAAPLAALPSKIDGTVAAAVALRDSLAKQKVVVDVRDVSLRASVGGMEIGLRDVDFALQPRVGKAVGRVALSLGLMMRGRSAGTLSLSTALPAALSPLELAVSAQGDDLARVVASLDPRLGLGKAPALQIDGWVVAGPGIGGELRASVAVRQIGIDWWRFAERKVDDVALDVELAMRWPADLAWLRVDVGDASFGAASSDARMRASGWALLHRLRPSPRVDLSLLLPQQDCGVALDAIPQALLPTVGRIRARGPTSGWIDLRLDIAHPWYSEIDFALDDARCRIEGTGKLDVDGLKEDFERPVNEDGRLLADQTFGPLSPGWIPIGRMPRWLPYAMTTTEDGGFFQHHGLNAFLLNRAIRLDLHVGRFVYGGSTITQQLAKNLFFRRTKVLSRKLEEALATWLLERRLGKVRILEIYANAVEMAPHLYGVARGAEYYFGKDASQLGPSEAAWLGILKPCPRCAGAHFRAKSMPVWYQQRLLEILTRMWRNHIIDDATFELWQNRVPPFVDWPAEKLAQRSAWPIPEKKEPEPRRLDRGRLGDGARTEKARTPRPAGGAAPRGTTRTGSAPRSR